ncbi:hypothetical protein HDV06_003629 [Boothiomyces sp. JEL0866]|nr:hypothetical protein HDV06_003629 [Boothiomyces sp. JEL0866]
MSVNVALVIEDANRRVNEKEAELKEVRAKCDNWTLATANGHTLEYWEKRVDDLKVELKEDKEVLNNALSSRRKNLPYPGTQLVGWLSGWFHLGCQSGVVGKTLSYSGLHSHPSGYHSLQEPHLKQQMLLSKKSKSFYNRDDSSDTLINKKLK